MRKVLVCFFVLSTMTVLAIDETMLKYCRRLHLKCPLKWLGKYKILGSVTVMKPFSKRKQNKLKISLITNRTVWPINKYWEKLHKKVVLEENEKLLKVVTWYKRKYI